MGRDGMSPNGRRDIDRLVERWQKEAHPIGLPAGLVNQTGRKRTGPPVRVTAAIPVHYSYSDTLMANAEVIEWTDSAVKIRVVMPPFTHPQELWVWASAVQRQDN